MTLAIWAEAPDVPGKVCGDARLRGGEFSPSTTFGQAGWDMGIGFETLHDLAAQLYVEPAALPRHACVRDGGHKWGSRRSKEHSWSPFDHNKIRPGQVSRLAIHCHGLTGELRVDGKKAPGITAANISRFASDLASIGKAASEDATILLVGCLAGRGKKGSALLIALSKHWPGRRVVGFTTIGFVSAGNQLRPGEGCTEPGMRDTDNVYPALSWSQQQKDYGPKWSDLKKLPWATEKSRHAKVALDGKIVRYPKQ